METERTISEDSTLAMANAMAVAYANLKTQNAVSNASDLV